MSHKKITLILVLGIFLSSMRSVNAQTQTFSYTGALQTWTVPCATTITIVANGAQGGTCIYGSGGLGATITGTFTVTPGQVLNVLVGQAGTGGPVAPNYFYCGSGGGGTYVWNSASSSLPMIVAGGGGGGSDNGNGSAGAGSATQAATPAVGGQGSVAGGTGGNGGAAGAWSGSGAGWLSNGGAGSNAGGGLDPANGGAGGTYNTPGYTGGFGGGGGCNGNNGSGGGGGGYNGGGGGIGGGNWSSGGGGGSYNGGTNQTNLAGNNTGNGSVTITWSAVVIPVTVTGHVINNEVTCNGSTGKATGIATGVALTYSWTPSGQTKDTATGLTAGTYTIVVNSPCGGSASASVTITQPANVITANAIVNSNVFCHGGSDGSASAVITGVGTPYTYLWTPSGETTATATGLAAGTYSVQIYNACGASATASTIITQPSSLSIAATVTANVLCNGGNNGSISTFTNSGTSPYTYAWTPTGGNLDTAVGLMAGVYTVTLTDNNGCTGSTSATITQPNVLTTSVTIVNNVLCNGGSSGSAMSTPNGGTSPYTYAWTGGETTATANGLSIGTYTVNVIDMNGCSTSSMATLTQPAALDVRKFATFDSIGRCTGSAWVMVNGGVNPYTYSWSNGSTNYALHYVCHDTFCYHVTDNHGCVDSGCIIVPTDLGVSNISSVANKVTIYPNPNNGVFNLEISNYEAGNNKIEIYNMLGEKVYTQLTSSNTQSTINLTTQPQGIYLYRVISNTDGTLLGQGKIVINK